MNSLPPNLEVFAELGSFNRHVDLHMRVVDLDNPDVVHVVQTVQLRAMQRHEHDSLLHEPAMRLRMNAAQRVMDELWRCGLRPSEGTGSAGSLAATERHLGDMQRIAYHLLKLPGSTK
jgi:hypothetical protein